GRRADPTRASSEHEDRAARIGGARTDDDVGEAITVVVAADRDRIAERRVGLGRGERELALEDELAARRGEEERASFAGTTVDGMATRADDHLVGAVTIDVAARTDRRGEPRVVGRCGMRDRGV